MVKSGQGSRSVPKSKDKMLRGHTQRGSSGHKGTPIDARVQQEIGKHLRAVYDDVINEPVPDKFMELLERLEQSTTRKT